MKWFLFVVKDNYANFKGRARRSEFWWFACFNLIISSVVGYIGTSLLSMPYLSGIYAFAVLVPSIAVSVRRLHDIGKSGWMVFIGLIPVIGLIWLFILSIKDSVPGSNQYGENPKGVS